MDISIIIPCYNEEKGIDNLRKQLNPVVDKLKKEYSVELIFVDDGSSDNTNVLLHKEYGNKRYAKIIKHPKNMNLGAALKTGFKNATGDLIFTLDSDCTYKPAVIFPMLDMIKDADMVTVSPCHPKGKIKDVEWYRLFLSMAVLFIYRLLVSMKIYTYGAMVRLYKKEFIKKMNIKSNDFLSVSEIMVKSILGGYKIKELPTTLSVRQYGGSKMQVFSTIMSHSSFIFRIILFRLLGVPL